MSKSKVIAFGDSIMKGVVFDASAAPHVDFPYVVTDNKFSQQCSRQLGIDVHNFGKFGSTISDGEKIISRKMSAIEGSEYVLLEYGGNDCDFDWASIASDPSKHQSPRTLLTEFVNRYSAIIDRLKAINARPVILSLPPLDPQRYFDFFSRKFNRLWKNNVMRWLGGSVRFIESWHEQYNLQTFKLAVQKNVPIIDITSAFLSKRNVSDYLCVDGIHPNEQGHNLITDTIIQHCRQRNIVFTE